MNESNGYKTLRPGHTISTEDPYTQDLQVRQQTAAHFGWASPK